MSSRSGAGKNPRSRPEGGASSEFDSPPESVNPHVQALYSPASTTYSYDKPMLYNDLDVESLAHSNKPFGSSVYDEEYDISSRLDFGYPSRSVSSTLVPLSSLQRPRPQTSSDASMSISRLPFSSSITTATSSPLHVSQNKIHGEVIDDDLGSRSPAPFAPHFDTSNLNAQTNVPLLFSRRSSSPSPPPFNPGKPSDSYFAQSENPSIRSNIPLQLLLVLDLNGTLVFRPPHHTGNNRPAYPRPYMGCFAQFIAKHESIQTMIWSSARTHNVISMVDTAFGPLKDNLKHIWARNTLGLSQEEFFKKVQTVKNMDTLWSGLPPQPNDQARFSSADTILLDDSALKAHMQPYNHLILPEYDVVTRRQDLSTLEELSNGQSAPAKSFDQTLLAVMGILDEAAFQTNVSNWIRCGGLWAGFTDGSHTGTIPEETPMIFAKEDSSLDTRMDTDNDPASGLCWYDKEECLNFWVSRGLDALRRLDIEVEHGIVFPGSQAAHIPSSHSPMDEGIITPDSSQNEDNGEGDSRDPTNKKKKKPRWRNRLNASINADVDIP